jgi:tetratricopeptide (TPR) repeat protein
VSKKRKKRSKSRSRSSGPAAKAPAAARKAPAKRAPEPPAPPPADKATGPIPGWVLAVLIALITIVLYWPTLTHGFALDDQAVLEENRFVGAGVQGIADILSSSYWEGRTANGPDYYRPLSLVSFAIEADLSNNRVPVLKLVHVLVAALTGAVTLGALRGLLPKRPALTTATALLFVVHPLHTEVIANLKSRDELYGFLFGVLALWVLNGFATKGDVRRAVAGGVCMLLALLSKESALTWLVAIPAALFLLGRAPVKQVGRATAPLVVAVVVWAGIRILAVGSVLPDHPVLLDVPENNALFQAEGFSERWGTTSWLFARALALLVAPLELRFDYSVGQIPIAQLWHPVSLLGLVAGAGLIGGTGWALTQGPRPGVKVGPVHLTRGSVLAFAGVFFIVTWSVASNTLTWVRGSTLAERYLFTPSLAWCLVLALGAERLAGDAPFGRAAWIKQSALWLGVVGGLTALGITRSAVRVPNWADTETLVQNDFAITPTNPRMAHHFGNVVTKADGDVDAAVAQLDASLAIVAEDPARYTELQRQANLAAAKLLATDGRCGEALPYLDAALAADPTWLEALFQQGTCLYHDRQFTQAVTVLQHAIEVRATDPRGRGDGQALGDYLTNLCLSALNDEQWDVGVQACSQAIEENPDNATAVASLGLLQRRLGNHDEATRLLRRAVELDPSLAAQE